MTRIAALLMIALLGTSPAMAQTDSFDFATGGRIQEFVVSVSSIDRTRAAFTDVLKWRVIEQGKADPSVARLWGLDVDTPINQVLVGNAQSKYGYVRLVEIDRPDRQIIRPGGRWWDTGGMFNFNVLVRDLDATIAGLRQRGWTSVALPEVYERPGNVRGKSMIMIGPDDLVVSFQERQSPPLQGWPPFDGAAHIEVGYQVVTDVARWFEFYTGTLGFPAVGGIRDTKNPNPIGQNSYGLPHNLVGVMDGRQANIRPRDKMEQSLGARQFPNAVGHDFSDRARPPNLGIVSARLPVADIVAMRETLIAAKADIVSDLQVVKLSPYGDVRALVVRSPGGSGFWLELFQPGAKPMTEDELKSFTKNGRYSTWTRFNNKLTGSVVWRPNGTAHVKWDQGSLDEEGTWTVKGDAVCTAWFKLRNNRELCVHHYRLSGDTTQSYRLDGTPDGIHEWRPAGEGVR